MMSMSGMSNMATPAATHTASAHSGHMSHGGMSSMGGMDMGASACKISMTWNWYTVDACFISDDWRITSDRMMAGSCIGVIVLVIVLEFIRRLAKEYDRYILRQHLKAQSQSQAQAQMQIPTHQPDLIQIGEEAGITQDPASAETASGKANASVSAVGAPLRARLRFRPSLPQQLVRAALHMVQFAVAYFVMLLAMYFNGYIIISILIGAFLGGFVFTWEWVEIGSKNEELTMCCG